MTGKILAIWLAASLFVAPLAVAEMEIIQLRSRTVKDVLPVLKPLLNGEGALSGIDDQLIVRTSPENLAMIKKVLAQIDRPLRNLLITVKQGVAGDSYSSESEISVTGKIGERGVIGVNPGSASRGGVVVGGSSGEIEGRGRFVERRGSEDSSHTQQVRTLDGREATIHMTLQIPIVVPRVDHFGFGHSHSQSVSFQNVTTGIRVLPQSNGDRVTLSVQPQLSSLQPGGIQVQQTSTTVSGKLGEWIEVGGLAQQSSGENSGILQWRQSRGAEDRSIYLKVEAVD